VTIPDDQMAVLLSLVAVQEAIRRVDDAVANAIRVTKGMAGVPWELGGLDASARNEITARARRYQEGERS
jgi:hypothetical protein